jgi:hypothetical protein
VILVSLLVAPLVMVVAAQVERRLGPSAAGWLAALPISFTVAILAVTVDAGAETAGAMALSAATHVPAQIAFGIVFAAVLVRRGLVLGAAAGTLAYAAGALALTGVPAALAVLGALPLLALAPRLMAAGGPRPASPRRWPATALSCVGAVVVVAGAVLASRHAGPETAGALAAFPSVSMALAVTVIARDGRRAGAYALAGLVRSLPCYLAFCLVVALAVPAAGPAAVALGPLACVAAARATWRGVPVAPRVSPGRMMRAPLRGAEAGLQD